MNLAWLSYWWKRMEREVSKDSADRMERKKVNDYLAILQAYQVYLLHKSQDLWTL
jgi:hypothetical protein